MPRFAVCVCGDLRGFARISWALERRLIAPTTRGGGQVDLFFHLWSDGSSLEEEGLAATKRLPGVVRVVVEPTVQRRNLTAATYSWRDDRRMAASGSFEAFRSQWRKVHLCFEEAFAHGRRIGPGHYDAFVRTRADTLHLVDFDLAAEHRRMVARVRSLSRSSEYVAVQACLTPWPMVVPDQWAVATPAVARQLAALPTPDEPSCCERWVEHRLKSIGVVEPTEGADAEHPAVCRRSRTLGVLPPSGGDAAMPVLLLSSMHSLHLGARCFTTKIQTQKRLPADNPSCTPQWRRSSSTSGHRALELAADMALRPQGDRRGSAHGSAQQDSLQQLLRLNSTSRMGVLSYLARLVRRSACRCENGAATPL